jgi:hypothetical protein
MVRDGRPGRAILCLGKGRQEPSRQTAQLGVVTAGVIQINGSFRRRFLVQRAREYRFEL